MSPTVRLPCVRGLSPNLAPTLALPERLVANYGPKFAAQHCDAMATGFLQAYETGATVWCPHGSVITPYDVEQVGLWLADCARAIETTIN